MTRNIYTRDAKAEGDWKESINFSYKDSRNSRAFNKRNDCLPTSPLGLTITTITQNVAQMWFTLLYHFFASQWMRVGGVFDAIFHQ